MRAWVQDVYGSAEVMRLAEVPDPVPGAGEVLVRVAAVSVNAADWHLMRGEPRVARLDRTTFGRRAPKQPIRGRDVAGTVVAVGPDVQDWRVGDEVLGEHEGTMAELVAVPATCLARRPTGVGVVEAAALPLAATTAATCLDAGRVGEGTRLLVIGASGGVGTYAVQLAVARVPRSPVSAAPATSTWSPRWGRARCSTTPAARWSGPRRRTTSCWTSWATGPSASSGAWSRAAVGSCWPGAGTRARVATWVRSGSSREERCWAG